MTSRRDISISIGIFVAVFAAYYASPVLRVTDSTYTMLLAEQLWTNQSFELDRYFSPYVDSTDYFGTGGMNPAATATRPRHVREVAGHLYYHYPHGTAVLAVPFAAAGRAFGISTIDRNGRYVVGADRWLQRVASGFITALAVAITFLTARLCLPAGWSVMIATAFAFSSQLWSTASRSLQSHACEVALLSAVVFLMFRAEEKQRRAPPILVGTLLSWAFFVRPTAALCIAPLALFAIARHRRDAVPLIATGAAWFAAFVAYSFVLFDQWLPPYYIRGDDFDWTTWPIGLAAQMISPSRGLFVYLPWLLLLAYALLAYHRQLRHRWLAATVLFTICLHSVLVAGNRNWWGGVSYGPRFHTELVPLFALLGILALRAALDRTNDRGETPVPVWRRRLEVVALALGVSAGLVIHGAGALSRDQHWDRSVSVHLEPTRVFDWRWPQWACALRPVACGEAMRPGSGATRGAPFKRLMRSSQSTTPEAIHPIDDE